MAVNLFCSITKQDLLICMISSLGKEVALKKITKLTNKGRTCSEYLESTPAKDSRQWTNDSR